MMETRGKGWHNYGSDEASSHFLLVVKEDAERLLGLAGARCHLLVADPQSGEVAICPEQGADEHRRKTQRRKCLAP